MHHSAKNKTSLKKAEIFLHVEVNKFTKSIQTVNKNYREFNKIMKRMNDDSALKRIASKSECSGEIPEDVRTELEHYLNDNLSFVIFGQSQYGKVVLTNEILGKQILSPHLSSVSSAQTQAKWRTVRFKYGVKQSLTLSLPGDNYDLVDNLSGHGKQWHVVPEDDLLLSPNENADSAHSAAFLDVYVNHTLLKDGTMVVTTPTYDRTNAEQIRNTYLATTNGSKLVVLLFALDSETLTQEDITELEQLRQLHSDDGAHASILFCVVPNPETYQQLWRQRYEISGPLVANSTLFSGIFGPPGGATGFALKASLSVDSARFAEKVFPVQSPKAGAGTGGGVSSKSNDDLTADNLQKTPEPQKPPRSPRSAEPDKLSRPQFLVGQSRSEKLSSSTEGVSTDDEPGSEHDTGSFPASPNCRAMDSIPLEADLSSLGLLECFVPMCEFSWQEEIRLSRGVYHDLSVRKQQHFRVNSIFLRDFVRNFHPRLVEFTHELTRKWLFRASHLFQLVLQDFLQSFVLLAYELAYDLMVTPKKTEFARLKEQKLYEKLLQMTRDKQPELNELISSTLRQLKEEMPERVKEFEIQDLATDRPLQARQYKLCIFQLRQHVLKMVDGAITKALCASITDLRETYGGAIERCLQALERNSEGAGVTGSPPSTIQSLQSILKTAYEVKVARPSSSNFISTLMDKLKELLYTLPWQPGLVIDDTWKQHVATDLLSNISEAKIFRLTSDQISARLRASHEEFTSALRKLEVRIEVQNSESEEVQDRIRRAYAPRLAHIAFEVNALRDAVLFGVPPLQRELGRGQYGVVYSIARGGEWGPFGNCCVKSVVPPDEKHWQDLSLEFFYTSNLPPHERVVRLYGAVIEPHFSGGNPAALLVMERMRCDLHSAMRTNLSWPYRLQVAIDVVEGIRYLHSQGLIHRDIKLKNVLLDKEYRAKLTDLGFCKPHAMMSGSVVGTPIHMAPELLRGQYHSSVDVYAFGILFWYICANTVKLPYKFEHYQSKDELWSAVRNGLRPEKLPDFDEACWRLMCQCWHGDPLQRPFPGDVERFLRGIYERTVLGLADTTEEIGKVDYMRMERQMRQSMQPRTSTTTAPQCIVTPPDIEPPAQSSPSKEPSSERRRKTESMTPSNLLASLHSSFKTKSKALVSKKKTDDDIGEDGVGPGTDNAAQSAASEEQPTSSPVEDLDNQSKSYATSAFPCPPHKPTPHPFLIASPMGTD